MPMTLFDPHRTALVLIDLQRGILAMKTEPYTTDEVLARSSALAERFRKAGAAVVLVSVDFGSDFRDAPPGLTDASPSRNFADGWTLLAEGLQKPGDLHVTKHQWSAFHGTDLDVKLRRRGIDTIVIGGIATNFGVESTARLGWEYGYHVVVAEDACTTVSRDLHDLAITSIFPRIARVLRSGDIAFGHV